MAKYHNVKITRYGIKFDSLLELSVYEILRNQEIQGLIRVVGVHPSVKITDAGILCKPDFECMHNKGFTRGELFYVEAKGMETATWRLKRRLWMCYGPAPIHIYKGTAAKPVLHEIIKGGI